MSALALRGFGGFPPVQFGPPNRFNKDGYARRAMSFAPHYPSLPLYQPPTYPAGGYASNGFDQFQKPNIGSQFISFVNGLDEEYRYDQYLANLEKMQRKYWRQQGNTIPPPMYTSPVTQFPQNYAAPYPPFSPNYAAPYPPFPQNYSAPLEPYPPNYFAGSSYEYQRSTRYLPYPIYVYPGGSGYGTTGNLGYGTGSNFNFGSGGGENLAPKIRVIFIPTGYSSCQQACTGALTMPSFLYNRVSQPWNSFPVPPPLPQLGSLSLTPAVQQMVMQRYSNPLAVMPLASNWQMPQQMMSGWPQLQQQQSMPLCQSLPPAPQSYIPPPMSAMQSFPPAPQSYISPPMSAMQSFPSAPQSYIPPPMSAMQSFPSAPQSYIPPPMSAMQSFTSAPQSYIPPPMSAMQSFPSAPQSYGPPPMPAFQSLPPAPQSYISQPMPAFQSFPSNSQSYGPPPMPAFQSFPPNSQSYIPPPSMPDYLPILPPPPPFLTTNAVQSAPQYSNTGYPSTCRACPPAPPPLNISVQGHCWIQHCSACHHVPIPTGNANVRPAGGRITPLLRHPTVPQYVPDQTIEQQNVYANAPVMMRPWLRKSPPLPPGAIVVAEEYFDPNVPSRVQKAPQFLPYPIHIPNGYNDGNSCYPRRHHSRKENKSRRHHSGPVQRSRTATSSATSLITPPSNRNRKSVSPERKKKNNNNSTKPSEPIKSKRTTSSSSSASTSSKSISVEDQKVTTKSNQSKQKTIPEESPDEGHNISLRYNYQPQEVSSVYLINRYIKSSSEASTSSLYGEILPDYSLSSIKDHSPIRSPSFDLNSIKEESTVEDEKKPRLLFREQQPKKKMIIIRQFRKDSSLSTMSGISSNEDITIINKDSDSSFSTSTLTANQ